MTCLWFMNTAPVVTYVTSDCKWVLKVYLSDSRTNVCDCVSYSRRENESSFVEDITVSVVLHCLSTFITLSFHPSGNDGSVLFLPHCILGGAVTEDSTQDNHLLVISLPSTSHLDGATVGLCVRCVDFRENFPPSPTNKNNCNENTLNFLCN